LFDRQIVVSDSVLVRPHSKHKGMLHIKTSLKTEKEMQDPKETGEWSQMELTTESVRSQIRY